MDKKDNKEQKKSVEPGYISASRPAPWPNNPHLKQIKSKAEFLSIVEAESDD